MSVEGDRGDDTAFMRDDVWRCSMSADGDRRDDAAFMRDRRLGPAR